ncbi:hypothetical protein LTR78_004217 [Recurvomyces mirabilis]|uniref:Uncharacterized protein n=1 Tax=Recurvomyces mirabilis TaxID=574656 RepID=A0AAE0WQB6_9PEZI|nr:hypothetical protein LTR78_004217 [Recurvomyces mirabilis]
MRYISTILGLILASTTPATASYGPSNFDACANKAPAVINAIGQFCQKTDGVVPSDWAGQGHQGPTGITWIKILGNCNPPQWVPQEYCFSQFEQSGLTVIVGM